MKLPKNVKIKPGWWKIVPWLYKYTAQAIYPNIYFSKENYHALIYDNTRPELVAALLHEQEHIKRQKREGMFKWSLKYIFLPNFRFQEELVAIKVSMKYLKKKRVKYDFGRKARILSGWLYFWPVSYVKAKRDLGKAWEES